MKNFNIFAHRGDSKVHAENTLAAFQSAISLSTFGIELDVQLTKDNCPVVIHDETIDRTCIGHTGFVKDLSLKELLKINKDIPTLSNVYSLLSPSSLVVNVELKTDVINYPLIEEIVIDLTKKHNMMHRVIFSSFNHNTLKNIKTIDKTAVTAVLTEKYINNAGEYVKSLSASYLHPDFSCEGISDMLKSCKDNNIAVNLWTVDDIDSLNTLIKSENTITGIITNYPKIFSSYLEA